MNEHWERLKLALSQENTPEARHKAAEAFRQYHEATGTSNRTIAGLGLPYENVPGELESNPAIFDKLKKLVTGG